MKIKKGIILILIGILIISSFGIPVTSEIFKTELIADTNEEGTRALADSPWPCQRGNMRNTGLSPYDTSSNTMRIRWSQSNSWLPTSPVIGPDDTIYICSNNGDLHAISTEGEIKWKFNTGDYIADESIYSPAIASDGTIYIGSSEPHFYAINPNGTLKWKYTHTNVGSPPSINSNGIIYVGFYDGLYAFYPNGTIKWKYYTNGSLVGFPPAIGSDGVIYAGTYGCLLALNPEGTKKWEYNTSKYNTSFGVGSPVIDGNGNIYIGSGYSIIAIKSNGQKKWEFITKDVMISSPGLGPDGSIYIGATGSDGDVFYSISSDGKFQWKLPINFMIGYSPSPVIGSKGIIYMASSDENFYAIYPNGSIKWKYDAGIIIYSTPAIGPDGTLYIAFGGKFSAFGIGKNLPPLPPDDLNAIVNNGCVDLNWLIPIDDGGAQIKSYSIYRGPSEINMSLISTVDGPTTCFMDTTVTMGQTYCYHVTATNKYGESTSGNIVFVTPFASPEPPTDLEALGIKNQIRLRWNKPIDDGGAKITHYTIYRGESSEYKSQLMTVNFATTEYFDKNVTNGQMYYYHVTAVNEYGESESTLDVSDMSKGVPTPPLNLKATTGIDKITITWQEPKNKGGLEINKYFIYRGTRREDNEVYAVVEGTNNSYTDKDVDQDSTYYYKITAINDMGEGQKSEELSASTEKAKTEGGTEGKAIFSETWVVIIILIIIVVVILVIAALMLKRKSISETTLYYNHTQGEPLNQTQSTPQVPQPPSQSSMPNQPISQNQYQEPQQPPIPKPKPTQQFQQTPNLKPQTSSLTQQSTQPTFSAHDLNIKTSDSNLTPEPAPTQPLTTSCPLCNNQIPEYSNPCPFCEGKLEWGESS